MARYAKFFSVGGGGGGTNNLQLPVGTVLDTTLRQVQDGLGTGSPLYISTLRVGITSDSSVTTQTSSVIQATTTNANLVIAPNGTGALIADIPDGTATGGNARGTYAVDLQLVRGFNYEVASGAFSFAAGVGNTASGQSSIAMGERNLASGNRSTAIGGGGGAGGGVNAMADFATAIGGFQNNASGQYSGIFGGSTNTASTNTHATVVGGQSNVSSGAHALSGGYACNATGTRSTAFGEQSSASGLISFAAGSNCTATGITAFSLGNSNAATSSYSLALGLQSRTYLISQLSSASGQFATQGDSQQSLLTANRAATLNSAATTVLSLDGTGTTNLIIPNGNNRLWAVKVVATAFVSVAGGTLVLGDSYMGEFTLLFKRVGGTSSVVGVNSANLIYDTNMATAAFTFAAGASQDLQITFKAPTTASATTFRCVAKVELVEVAY